MRKFRFAPTSGTRNVGRFPVHTSAEIPISPAQIPVLARWALVAGLISVICVVVAVAIPAFHKSSRSGIFSHGCDSFCYSQMAAAIRDARASGKPVDYFLQDYQTEFLITKFKQSGVLQIDWREAIAPHGYHYFAVSGQVGPQYPPGAPWALSFFPAIGAIRGLSRASIILIVLVGLAFAGWCAARRLPLSTLVAALATYTFLYVFTWVDLTSFSVNATIFPLFAGILLAWFARERARGVVAVFLSFAGGVGIGMAVEDRVASVLLVATMLLFFLPRRYGLVAAQAAGLAVGGVLPLLTHNKLVAGGYFLPTYDKSDTDQSLQCIWTNFLFYCHWWFQNSIVQVTMLACALAALVVLVRATSNAPAGHWRHWAWDHAGFILAAPSAFLLCAAFFLTHVVKEGYYLTPSMLTVALTTALLFVSLEIEWRTLAPEVSRRAAISWTVITLAISGAALTVWLHSNQISDAIYDAPPDQAVQISLPPELQNEHAWLWADDLSGSIRLYTGHPAFKIYACNPTTRKMVFDWVKARGEPQYVVEDSETMRHIADEARNTGWKTTLVGYVCDSPCLRMDPAP